MYTRITVLIDGWRTVTTFDLNNGAGFNEESCHLDHMVQRTTAIVPEIEDDSLYIFSFEFGDLIAAAEVMRQRR